VIPISIEAQLMALVAFFYVYDAAQLLYANEGVISPAGKEWLAASAKNGWTLRGRSLFLPNLLTPHRPIYRLLWNSSRIDAASEIDWQAEKRLYRPLIPVVYGMGVALFGLLPAALFYFRSDIVLLACAVLIYLQSLFAGIALFTGRQRLHISSRKAWALFVECLLCPPFAINLIRKLSSQRAPAETFVGAAFRLLDQEQWPVLRDDLIALIELEMTSTGTEQETALLRSKNTLLGMNK
jgi:hypothetical protein